MVSSTGLNHLISFYKKVQVHFGQNKKTGYLKPETAKKINQAALTGLFISAAPTVYKKVEQTNLLESIANGIVKISTNAISKI